MLRKLSLFALLCAVFVANVHTSHAAGLKGKTLYTQVNIYSLKGKSVTWVNYQVDSLIPVNTEVTVNYARKSGLAFTIKKTGQKLELNNKKRHSGLDDIAWANKHLGEEMVDLSKFTDFERDAIHAAQVKTGMSRDAVIVSRGYPPAHKTPDLNASEWLYWHNRWNKMAVTFDADGKVSGIRE
ncbi:MAG: hypothetical protein AUJ57_03240 [Zetaproteobacteria bacterium CG1_02_53_45]|nr:MAG: hypothetical protein AUJ57_03240 [Zetaproteobacteria bacterium CG1_02_53_45]